MGKISAAIEEMFQKAMTLTQVAGNVCYDNISFKYNINTPYVIDGFSLHIKPKMRVGLVGRSGGEKNTITKLIQRLYIANKGTIYIDGVDIKHMNPSLPRKNIKSLSFFLLILNLHVNLIINFHYLV